MLFTNVRIADLNNGFANTWETAKEGKWTEHLKERPNDKYGALYFFKTACAAAR